MDAFSWFDLSLPKSSRQIAWDATNRSCFDKDSPLHG